MLDPLSAAITLIAAFLLPPPPDTDARDTLAPLRTVPGPLPVPIIENRGQFAPDVRFSARGTERSIEFHRGGLTLTERSGARIEIRLTDAPSVDPRGLEPTRARFHLFHGAPEHWITGARAFGAVAYTEAWPGIDAIYRAGPGHIKYAFEVHAGADPSRAALDIRGADSVTITPAGELVIRAPGTRIVDPAPVAWQPAADGTRTPVDIAWELRPPATTIATGTATAMATTVPDAPAPGHRVGFRIGTLDPTRSLHIDPTLLVTCGFLGGAAENHDGSEADDVVSAVAYGPDGSLYVAGSTTSTAKSFPARGGPSTEAGGDRDAFVARLDPETSEILFCGFIGGANRDEASSIAVSEFGRVFFGGTTYSDETSFPVVSGPSTSYGGRGDGFAGQLSEDGATLLWCGYVGTPGPDWIADVALDRDSEEPVVVGGTGDVGLPVEGGPGLDYGGSLDAFVGRIESGGRGFRYLTYLGGAFDDAASGVALDDAGRACLVGRTFSNEASFPVRVGPDLEYNHPVPGFTQDAFVARLSADGATLEYCGYIGGINLDLAAAVAVDDDARAIVTGSTLSDESTFPVVGGPRLEYSGGAGLLGDAFVARVASDGTRLETCGYLGGGSGDAAHAVATDGRDAFLTGVTYSHDFPAVGEGTGNADPAPGYGGAGDAFLARVDPAGQLHASGFFGGPAEDAAHAIALRPAAPERRGEAPSPTRREVAIAGAAASIETELPIVGGPSVAHAGGSPGQAAPTDGFVVRWIVDDAGDIAASLAVEPAVAAPGTPVTISVRVRNDRIDPAPVVGVLEIIRPDGSFAPAGPLAGPASRLLRPDREATRKLARVLPEATPPGVHRVRLTIRDEAGLVITLAEAELGIEG